MNGNPFPGPIRSNGTQFLRGTCGQEVNLDVFAGELLMKVDLVDIPTVGHPLSFFLTYASRESTLDVVGYKWWHNWLVKLDLMTGSGYPYYATYYDESRQTFTFKKASAVDPWVLDQNTLSGTFSAYIPAYLVESGADYLLHFHQDQASYRFNSTGQIIKTYDQSGNETTISYSSGLVDRITEPTGRYIQLGYTSGRLSSVTDPLGKTTNLSYDAVNNNLTGITSPAGCVSSFGYGATPGSHLIATHTDPLNHTFSFTFDGSGRVLTVKDAIANPNTNTLTYAYNPASEPPPHETEWADDIGGTFVFSLTRLTDARGKIWKYLFDLSGNLWRICDPTDHWTRKYWDGNQRLLWESRGFPFLYTIYGSTHAGPKENFFNAIRKFYNDNHASPFAYIDASGIHTEYRRDDYSQIASIYSGRAHFGVQGNWRGNFGQDGFLLCGYESGGADRVSYPAYVSSLSFVSGHTAVHSGGNGLNADPKAVESNSSLARQLGWWKATLHAPLQFTINLTQDSSFNLSFYTSAIDQTLQETSPVLYWEQFGHDITITVTDLSHPGGVDVRIFNTAPGAWVTFPVHGDDTHPITVKVDYQASNVNAPHDAFLNAIAFDPYENREVTFGYDLNRRVTSATDGLGNQLSYVYNGDGTVASITDARSKVTNFYYEDTAKNLTRMVDATGGVTRWVYDLAGNVLQVIDPNGNVQSFSYDDKYRLVEVIDSRGAQNKFTYNADGTIQKIQDPLGRLTQFTYTANAQLASLTDAASKVTQFSYDEAGAVKTVTDANSNVTQFFYDDAGLQTQVTLPNDSQGRTPVQTLGFNVLGQLVAVNSPNANQANLALINLVGAENLVLNPGLEELASSNASQPAHWSPNAGSLDTSVSHSGQNSLLLHTSGDNYPHSQELDGLYPGVQALIRAWVQKDNDAATGSASLKLAVRNRLAERQMLLPTPTSLPAGSASWTQLPFYSFHSPADAQYIRSSVQLRPSGSASATTNLRFDDFELYGLGVAYRYDREGRLVEVHTQDGSRTRLERDRFGRVSKVIDPLGKTTQLYYDALDRIVKITDGEGLSTAFGYDPNGNLLSFLDAKANLTQYAYDDSNRLSQITYPDTTQEIFQYDAGGRLKRYLDNQNRARTFHYDSANNLTRIQFADATQVVFSYNLAGDLISQKERNGDILRMSYDALNRPVSLTRYPASGNNRWFQSSSWDNNGNLKELRAEPVMTPVYGTAHYNVDHYASPGITWQVASPGFDAHNLPPGFVDHNSKTTTFGYDIEDRRIGITYPNPALNPVTTAAVYDILGRLQSATTTTGVTLLQSLLYGYDRSGNRISSVSDKDTYEFRYDKSSQLLRAALNRFVEEDQLFAAGTFDRARLDTAGTVQMLKFPDTLAATAIDMDRWRAVSGSGSYTSEQYVGFEMRAQDGGVCFAFPRGYTDRIRYHPPNNFPDSDLFGVRTENIYTWLEHRQVLSGEFDIQVDFEEYLGGPNSIGCWALLNVRNAQWPGTSTRRAYVARHSANAVENYVYATIGSSTPQSGSVATTNTNGKLRLKRSATGVLTIYKDNEGTPLATDNNFGTSDCWVSIGLTCEKSYGAVKFKNFTNLSQLPTDYPIASPVPSYVSAIYDTAQSGTVTWSKLSWVGNKPAGTNLQFQVAVSNSASGPWTFVGPDGTSGTYFTTSGTAVNAGTTGRYARYKAYLTANGAGSLAPSFSKVSLSYSKSGSNVSSLYSYEYDDAGNVLNVAVETDSGTSTQARTNNNLNQTTRNDVTPAGGGTTTWLYSYNGDGTMASKTDGTNTWTYTWDAAGLQQLTRVQGPGGVDVSYSYDSMGRMLTRTSGGVTTDFVWSGWDCIRETAGGITTRYHCPQGELLTFERSGSTYQCHSDALGSVRTITDSTGAVVARYDYDAWGNQLPSSTSQGTFAWAYGFVGSLGVRTDFATGMAYMRRRWYDPGLARFVSRDPLLTENLYAYTSNSPTNYVDPSGLRKTAIKCSSKDPRGKKRLENALQLLELYVKRSNRPELQVYTSILHQMIDDGRLDFKVETGFARHNVFDALMETQFDGRSATIFVEPTTLFGTGGDSGDPISLEATAAWALLHESVHIWQEYNGGQPGMFKERLPKKIASDAVLSDIYRFKYELERQELKRTKKIKTRKVSIDDGCTCD